MRFGTLLLMLLLMLTGGGRAAVPKALELVQPALLADVDAVVPGRAFTLAVHLKIAPQYHVYWKNPGDSGSPTTVSLTQPAGFVAGPVQYPVPLRIHGPGGLSVFGYEGEVLLLTMVTPPIDLLTSAGGATIRARVNFLVCDEQACIPGHADLTLTLPIRAEAKAANTDLLAKWRPAFPTPTDDIARLSMSSHPAGKMVDYAIDLDFKSPVSRLDFFPGPSAAVNFDDLKTARSNAAGHARVTFSANLLAGQKVDGTELPSLIAYTDSSGVRRAIEFPLPLTPLLGVK